MMKNRHLDKLIQRFAIDENTQDFIDFNKRKWTRAEKADPNSVILVDLVGYNEAVYSHSHVANYLAQRTGSVIETFNFMSGVLNRAGIPNRRTERLHESFGARRGLSFATEALYARQARKDARRLFEGLKTKDELLALRFDVTEVGHLIYDSYLRDGRPTLDLKDPELEKLICDSLIIYRTCKDYFARKRVRALLIVHIPYIWEGIIAQVALDHGVPVYFAYNGKTGLQIRQILPELRSHVNFPDYRNKFAALPEDQKEPARAQARKILEERLSGKLLTSQIGQWTGFGEIKGEPLLEETGRPRGLVLLHCFFDAVHGGYGQYRHSLFPDLWEWAVYLLTKASETPFDWYVKPHPGGLPGNPELVEKLKQMFPRLHFLKRSDSNRQIIAEGINAMFTVHGTAGHEFAYLGVPVVNAGDNPHVAYDFNLHPKSITEFDHYVESIDRIKLDMKKSEVEEFFYVHNFLTYPPNPFGAKLIDDDLLDGNVMGKTALDSHLLAEYVRRENPEKLERLRRYFDWYFSGLDKTR